MNRYFAIPNALIEDKCLTNSEIAVATYLFSLIRTNNKSSLGFCVKVKQSTIAERCGISIKTVSRTVDKLLETGFIAKKIRTVKDNNYLGTYVYVIARPELHGKYFYADRNVVKFLNRNVLRAYLLCCKCADSKRSFFQSYSELAKMLGVKRSEAIRIIKELVANSLIRVKKKLTKAGDYTDNHYCIKIFVKKKKKAHGKKHTGNPKFTFFIPQLFDFVKSFFVKSRKKLKFSYLLRGGGVKNVRSILGYPLYKPLRNSNDSWSFFKRVGN